jgi:hypothetical protein
MVSPWIANGVECTKKPLARTRTSGGRFYGSVAISLHEMKLHFVERDGYRCFVRAERDGYRKGILICFSKTAAAIDTRSAFDVSLIRSENVLSQVAPAIL